MPELPEVEQVRISLLPHIKGKIILKTEVRLPRMIHHPAVPDFIMGVEGRTVTDVRRRGKYLTLLLDSGSGSELELDWNFSGYFALYSSSV